MASANGARGRARGNAVANAVFVVSSHGGEGAAFPVASFSTFGGALRNSSTGSSGSSEGNGGGRGPQQTCPKCGSPVDHISFASQSKFVKCAKCSHFFIVLSDADNNRAGGSDRPGGLHGIPLGAIGGGGGGGRPHDPRHHSAEGSSSASAPAQDGSGDPRYGLTGRPPPSPKKIYEYLNQHIIGENKMYA